MTVQISLMVMLAMIGIGVLMILIFGVKNLMSGKHEIQKLVTMVTPFIIFGVTFGVMGDATSAAMATTLIMSALLVTFILVTGLRSTFKF